MKTLFLPLVFLMMALQTVSASAQFSSAGIGISKCQKFIEDTKTHGKEIEQFYFSWANGFMTALNLGFWSEHGTIRDLGATNSQTKIDFLRSYCTQKPDSDYLMGVLELVNSLPVIDAPEKK